MAKTTALYHKSFKEGVKTRLLMRYILKILYHKSFKEGVKTICVKRS